MAYVREVWKNREVERPRTFSKIDNPDGTITLVPEEGNVIEPGTPIIAAKMNNIEDGIVEALDKADQAFQSASDGKTVIANSITAKGVPASKEDTFPTLASKIDLIETDKTGDATATAADILSPKDAYVKGQKIKGTIPSKGAATITPTTSPQTIAAGQYLSGPQTIAAVSVPTANVLAGITIAGAMGTMPNRGAYNQTVTTQGGKITIPAGYHNGAGGITASFANLVAGNVKAGVNIGGVIGTMVGLKTAHGTPTGSFFTTPIIFGFKPKFFIHITDNPSSVEYHISMYSDGTLYPPINDVGGGFGYKFTPLPDGISWNSAVLLSKGSYFAVG